MGTGEFWIQTSPDSPMSLLSELERPNPHQLGNDKWVMPWFFNFCNRIGLGLHQYTLPGRPASHGCVRLLRPDAEWLFYWGQGWTLASDGQVLVNGTPVLIVGGYDYKGTRPWLQAAWWAKGVTLPASVLASLR